MQESGNELDLRELAAGNIPAITVALGAGKVATEQIDQIYCYT